MLLKQNVSIRIVTILLDFNLYAEEDCIEYIVFPNFPLVHSVESVGGKLTLILPNFFALYYFPVHSL